MNRCPETHEFRYQLTDLAVLAIFVLFLTLAFWVNLRNLPGTADPDALEMLAFARVFVDAVWNHQQFPMWNPYFGGGVPWAGVVWNPGLTPLSLILIPFGEVVGFKVWFALVLFFGAVGMYRVCTDILRTSRVAALLSGALFPGSLWAAGRLADGNYCEFGFLLLPLCIYAFHQFLHKHWVGFFLPVLYLAVLGMTGYEPFLVASFVLIFGLLFQRQMRASYAAIVLGWLGTFWSLSYWPSRNSYLCWRYSPPISWSCNSRLHLECPEVGFCRALSIHPRYSPWCRGLLQTICNSSELR
jgi:hypothetical protein